MDSNPADQFPPLGLWGRFTRAMTSNHATLDDREPDERLRIWRCPHQPAEVVRHLISWVNTRGRWDFAADTPLKHDTEIRLIHRSGLLRFVDDVSLALTASSNGTTVRAASMSRVGKGDLGQNRRNLIDLRNAIPDLRT